MRCLTAMCAVLLTGCGYVVIVDDTGGSGGEGGSVDCGESVKKQTLYDQLGIQCDTECEKPLTRLEAVGVVMTYVNGGGKNGGYYLPTFPTFQDMTTDSIVEQGVFTQVVLPEPYDGTAKFSPNDTADSCFTQAMVERAKNLPDEYVVPYEVQEDFTESQFSGAETETILYRAFWTEQLFNIRLVNDPSNQFISGTETDAVDKVFVRCESGDFSSTRLVLWPSGGKEVISEAPENCYDHGDGLLLRLSLTPAFTGEATIGISASLPFVRKWTNWQDSRKPAVMTVQ